jgi:ribosomal protein S18 acetylase RimI-like enzyme
VTPNARKQGVASALLAEVVNRLTALGAPRVVLNTAVQNDAAQKLFERHGFRKTMLEMTCELNTFTNSGNPALNSRSCPCP